MHARRLNLLLSIDGRKFPFHKFYPITPVNGAPHLRVHAPLNGITLHAPLIDVPFFDDFIFQKIVKSLIDQLKGAALLTGVIGYE